MNQEQYLARLRAALSNLPQAEQDEIIADYRAYFADAEQAGRSEADVMAALGEPELLAKMLRSERSVNDWQTHRSLSNLWRVLAAQASLGLFSAAVALPTWLAIAFAALVQVVAVVMMVIGLFFSVQALSSGIFGWPKDQGFVLNTSGVGPLVINTGTVIPEGFLSPPQIDIQGDNERFSMQRQDDGSLLIVAKEDNKSFRMHRAPNGDIVSLRVEEDGQVIDIGGIHTSWGQRLFVGVFTLLLGVGLWWLARKAIAALLRFWQRHQDWRSHLL